MLHSNVMNFQVLKNLEIFCPLNSCLTVRNGELGFTIFSDYMLIVYVVLIGCHLCLPVCVGFGAVNQSHLPIGLLAMSVPMVYCYHLCLAMLVLMMHFW